MERKDRHFNGEGKRECQEEPGLLMKGQMQIIKLEQIKSQDLSQLRMTGCEIDDRHQHQQAPGHGIEHEFDCGINAARSAHTPIRKYMGISITSQNT